MSTLLTDSLTPPAPTIADAVATALARVPPLWPLRNFVAVNPFVGLTDLRFSEACALLQRTTGSAPLQTPAAYFEGFCTGGIRAEDLGAAADSSWTVERLLRAVDRKGTVPEYFPLATIADRLDRGRPRAHWSVFVVEEISKWCAIAFDENQGTWRSPWRDRGLFAAWRDAARHDRNPEAFGLRGFRAFVDRLPLEATECIEFCLSQIVPEDVDVTEFLQRQLATISGWAGHVQYRVREDALRGRPNSALRDLLAVRLAYDAALLAGFGRAEVVRSGSRAWSTSDDAGELLAALTRWQFAFEVGYLKRLALGIADQPVAGTTQRAPVQAVFCIDVRSEVFRRHLEAALPQIQTIGFAGFFGFPVAHCAAGEKSAGSRCPVLLVPSAETGEPLDPGAEAAERSARAESGAWKAFQNSAISCFSFVESVGLAFGAALATSSRPSSPACVRVAPAFAGRETDTLEARADLAAGALRNMSLTRNFARLVLICGHGSRSANNPYASALDCGACGGHAGDVNARLAVAALNDPAVRVRLSARALVIPADTVFVAGLHETTTDEVSLFDLERVPSGHGSDLAALREALRVAAVGVRSERAASLGLSQTPASRLETVLGRRASDISEVRPEWGLANNAALVAAPRSRTAGLNLEGRVFLHDYDATADTDLKVLTLILSAPVVVASWINLQYYASRVDPERLGSGNKVLHNIVGGIGVLEGNGGDLRVGLPLQSIHDGRRFVHEPRRLTVVIDATRESIDTVLAAQAAVRLLFDHQWIHLVALEGKKAYLSKPHGWQSL